MQTRFRLRVTFKRVISLQVKLLAEFVQRAASQPACILDPVDFNELHFLGYLTSTHCAGYLLDTVLENIDHVLFTKHFALRVAMQSTKTGVNTGCVEREHRSKAYPKQTGPSAISSLV